MNILSRKLYVFLLLLCFYYQQAQTIDVEMTTACNIMQPMLQKKAPKIIILTSSGGNGHKSACDALQEILPDCSIKCIYPIYDYFHHLFDGENVYGKCLQKGLVQLTNFMVSYPGKALFKITKNIFKKRFLQLLYEEKPDLLISVIPLLNYPAIWAAKYYGIPFLLITLDANLDLWLLNMEKCRNESFTISVQMLTDRIKQQLVDKHISLGQIREVGPVLRKDFLQPKNKQKIKTDWSIPSNKKVIMLIRGGTGSNILVNYVKQLMLLDEPVHLLVCIGKNTDLIPELECIKNAKNVSFSIIPFTPKIPDLMAITDLLITQPSPNVCNEAIYMKIPLLIDMTSPCLFWEEATIDWIMLKGSGTVFNTMGQLNTLVSEYLKKDFTSTTKPQNEIPVFNTEIRTIIMQLLQRAHC